MGQVKIEWKVSKEGRKSDRERWINRERDRALERSGNSVS